MSSDSNVKSAKDVDTYTCKYVWTVPETSLLYYELAESPYFYPKNNNFITLRLEFQRIDEINAKVELNADNMLWDDLNYVDVTFVGEVAFVLHTTSNFNHSEIHFKDTFLLNKDLRLNSYLLTEEKGRRIPTMFGSLTINCVLTLFKLNDVIPTFVSHQRHAISSEVEQSKVLEDFGKLYLNEEHSDVTICIKSEGKESKLYPAHKIILACRSKVFEAMFRHDLKENLLRQIVVEGINEEVFLEALRYIYTGHVENLETLAFELLPVADRYDIEKLKISCEKTLSKKLSVENAVKILISADMCNVGDLKIKVIQFIKNHSDVIKKMDSNAWNDLITRPYILKEILIAIVS